MTYRHIKFSDSIVMRELEKIAHEKNLIPQKQIEKAASPVRETAMTKLASINFENEFDVFEASLCLASALREKNYNKQADDLEYKLMLFKLAYNNSEFDYEARKERESHLYDTGIGGDALAAAHDGIDQPDKINATNGGYIRSINDIHNAMEASVKRSPKNANNIGTSLIAQAMNSLVKKTAQEQNYTPNNNQSVSPPSVQTQNVPSPDDYKTEQLKTLKNTLAATLQNLSTLPNNFTVLNVAESKDIPQPGNDIDPNSKIYTDAANSLNKHIQNIAQIKSLLTQLPKCSSENIKDVAWNLLTNIKNYNSTSQIAANLSILITNLTNYINKQNSKDNSEDYQEKKNEVTRQIKQLGSTLPTLLQTPNVDINLQYIATTINENAKSQVQQQLATPFKKVQGILEQIKGIDLTDKSKMAVIAANLSSLDINPEDFAIVPSMKTNASTFIKTKDELLKQLEISSEQLKSISTFGKVVSQYDALIAKYKENISALQQSGNKAAINSLQAGLTNAESYRKTIDVYKSLMNPKSGVKVEIVQRFEQGVESILKLIADGSKSIDDFMLSIDERVQLLNQTIGADKKSR